MKKSATILLLALYLFSTTELYQILKLPVLIEHYYEHKEITPLLTFADFLSHHYKNIADPIDNYDFEQDQKLPFMMNSSFSSAVFVSHDIPSIEIDNSIVFEESRRFPPTNDPDREHSYLDTIWQPPKTA